LLSVRQRTDYIGVEAYAVRIDAWRELQSRLAGDARTRNYRCSGEEIKMLETIAILLFILWLLGMVSSHTFGGFIHILLVVAVVVVLVRIIRGRNPL
jgi:hypothetical protein